LDNLLAGGFYPEDLIVLGGRPSMGKSLLACTMAYQVAAMHQMPSLIFSLEMSADAIVQRYVSNLAQIEATRLRQGKILAGEWARVAQATDTLSQVPVLIDDTPCPSVEQIRSKVRATISQYKGLKLVVIDYLQLMVDGGDSRLVQRLGEITRQLKLLARECKVPILLLSQLNRGVEERSDKRPFQSDLRDSGRIEEDADVILFCYREQYYNPSTTERGVMEVICTKQRNGPTGTVKLLFDGAFNSLRNLASGS
jgi:replicative DNA helicase